MTPSVIADALVFAIHSALRLSDSIRRAYANSIRSRAIVLPLPQFDGAPNLRAADRFFEDASPQGGQQFLAPIDHLRELYEKNQSFLLTEEEKRDYLEYYETLFRSLQPPTPDSAQLQPQQIVGLLRIRQWEKGQAPQPSALQLVGGTLVEMGIDYFQRVPGGARRPLRARPGVAAIAHRPG